MPSFARMSADPCDGLSAPGFVFGDDEVESELEAALRRIRNILYTALKIGPADGLTLPVAGEAAQTLGIEQEPR